MDIDEFLDRELSDLGITNKNESPSSIEVSEFKEDFKPSPSFDAIKSNLSKGNLKEAQQPYEQLWHMLLLQKLKWNKEIYGQLSVLSKLFLSALNDSFNEAKRNANHVYELINRARASLREGKNQLAFKLYAEIKEVSDSVPNVFFEEKKIIEERVMDFYKELMITTDNELINRVSALIQEIYQLIEKIELSIRANDLTNAITNYNKCIELFNQVPEGFLRYKNSAGMRLLDIYKTLSIYTEMMSLQKEFGQGISQPQQRSKQANATAQTAANMNEPTKSMMLSAKKEHAKKNIEHGFYNEAYRDIQEAFQIDPNDAEAKAIHAKIKTLQ